MKFKLIGILVCLLCPFSLFSQTPTFEWVEPTPYTSYIVDVEVDQAGNVYSLGGYYYDCIFGNDTIFRDSLTSIFLTKQDPNGNYLWAEHLGGVLLDEPKGMAIDAAGFVYITGYLRSQVIVAGTAFGGTPQDAFLIKYAPNGNVVWAVNITGPGTELGKAVGVDAAGDVYVAFRMLDALTLQGVTLNTFYAFSVGVAKFDPSGNLIWANNYGHYSDHNEPVDIAVMPNGDHYVLGQAFDSLSIGGDTIAGNDDSWVAKFDAAGNYQWIRSLEGTNSQDKWYALDVAPNGDVHLAGDHSNLLQMGPFTIPTQGFEDLLVTRYDSAGNLLSCVGTGSPSSDRITDIAVDANGDFFITGFYSQDCNFGAGPVNSLGGLDAFIAKYDNAGNLLWLETGGCTMADWGSCIKAQGGRVYAGGASQALNIPFTMGGTTFSSTSGYITKILDNGNLLGGRVAMDYNFNGIYEASDAPWAGGLVNRGPGVDSRICNLDGHFYYSVDAGTHFLNLPFPPSYYTVAPPIQTVTFPSTGGIDTTNYFLLLPTPGITDVRVRVEPLTKCRPGGHYWVAIYYQNMGTVPASGTISFFHPSQLTYQSSNPAFTTQTGTNLTWNYTSLLPWETRAVLVDFEPFTFLGQGFPVALIGDITPLIGDANPLNNTSTLNDTTTYSYDPNDKLVMPSGPFTTQEASAGLELTYTIRFQNTGTDTAYVVRIMDTLAANLRPETMELLESSHTYSFQLHNNIAQWRFDPIVLPDSGNDYLGSMGFVKFKIKTTGSHPNHSTVENFADIYFDSNSPVRTPTALVRIMDEVGIAEEMDAQNGFVVFPNPHSGQCWIQSREAIPTAVQFTLWDIQGRKVWQADRHRLHAQEGVLLNSSNLLPGAYFLQIQYKDEVEVLKVLVD